MVIRGHIRGRNGDSLRSVEMVRGASSLYFSPPDMLTGKAARDTAVWRIMTWGGIAVAVWGSRTDTRYALDLANRAASAEPECTFGTYNAS